MAIILGTAGHIDHGKTSLVQALTGVDCDRLAEEKRRGITIELGFAYCDLPVSGRIGVVDVPGHEKFIKNMVAGASGIDIVMLVVAADEGVMPQTKEHIDICSLLNVKRGFVALTKTDLVEQEWLELTKEDLKLSLKDTFLEQAQLIPVSSKTGDGLSRLRTYLDEQAQKLAPSKNTTDLFRMPIDRAFTMKGYGTVVTGTIASGSISTGTEVELLPSRKVSKIRNIQNHGEFIQTATAGQRAAINIQGLDLSEVRRGAVLAKPKTLFPSYRWIISLTCLPSSPKPIKRRAEVVLHHGTQETYAQLYLLDKKTLAPGETGLCEVRFKYPLTGIFNDRCIIRSFSPLRTIAGGKLLNPLSDQSQKKTVGYLKQVSSLDDKQEALLVQTQIALAPPGISKAQLLTLTNLHTQKLEAILLELEEKNATLCFDNEYGEYVSFEEFQRLKAESVSFVENFHDKEPLKQGVERAVLLGSPWNKAIPKKLARFVLESLLKDRVFTAAGELVRLTSREVVLSEKQRERYKAILDVYIRASLTPPTLNELTAHNVDLEEAKPLINLLLKDGALVKVKENLYFSSQVLETLKENIISWFKTHKELDLANFKDICGGISRKYTIPLLEYFDKQCLTLRVGDARQLRKS